MKGIINEDFTRNFSELVDWAGENLPRATLFNSIAARGNQFIDWIGLKGIATVFDLAILLYLVVFSIKIVNGNASGYLKSASLSHSTLTRAMSRLSIGAWKNSDDLKNQEAWRIIEEASAREGGSNPGLLYAIWQAETGSVSCQPKSACTSLTGALGPCQFLPGTWDERDANGKLRFREENWDIWSLEDCSRAMARLIHYLNSNSWQNLQRFQRSSFTHSDDRAWSRWLPGFVQDEEALENSRETGGAKEGIEAQVELEKTSSVEQFLIRKMQTRFERAQAPEEDVGVLLDLTTQELPDRIIEKIESSAQNRYLAEPDEIAISAPVDDRIDLPVKGSYRITSRMGPRHPDGVDLAQTRGKPFDVYAACTGTITRVSWWQVEQNCDGYPGMLQAYWHVVPHVSRGDRVDLGQRVATTGKTADGSSWGGAGAGVHLHWVTIVDGVHRDPFTMITQNASE